MAYYLGNVLGQAAMFFGLLLIVLAIGNQTRLRDHPLAMHVVAVCPAWLLALAAHLGAPSPPAAYIMTLAAIWIYRREARRPSSGWYRAGAGLAVIWCGAGLASLAASHASSGTYPRGLLPSAWLFAAGGMAPWLLGWLVQRIRASSLARRGGSRRDLLRAR